MLPILLLLLPALSPALAWIVSDSYFLLLKHKDTLVIITILFNGGKYFFKHFSASGGLGIWQCDYING